MLSTCNTPWKGLTSSENIQTILSKLYSEKSKQTVSVSHTTSVSGPKSWTSPGNKPVKNVNVVSVKQ